MRRRAYCGKLRTPIENCCIPGRCADFPMTVNARVYITMLLLLGMSSLLISVTEWKPEQPVRFSCMLGVALGLALLRARLPEVAGQTSFTLLFILWGIADLKLPEVLLIGCASVMVESVWRPSRADIRRAYFCIANVAVAIAVAYRSANLAEAWGAAEEGRLAVATAVFFVCDTFSFAVVEAMNSGRRALSVWRERHAPDFVYYLAGGLLAFFSHTLSQIAGWPAALMAIPAVFLIYRTYRMHRARVDEQSDHAAEVEELQMRTIQALALAIEAKDTTTSDHLRRVQVYAVEIGRLMGMNDDELKALRAAAILHDVGKLAVPEYIISKPGRLTPAEFEKMKVHPVVGAEILEHVQFPYPVVPIVRAHHEKWNGTGYPFGIAGEEIPPGARILSAVDALDALASDRQYRRAMPLADAMAKIKDEAGRSFDPAVVEVLEQHCVELEAKAQQAAGITLKLSLDLKIANGVAPDAGFEKTCSVDLAGRVRYVDDPLSCIARARNDLQTLLDSGVKSGDILLDEFCGVFTARLRRAVPFDAVVLWVVSDDHLLPVFTHGYDDRYFSGLQIPMGQGLSGWVAENRKPIVNGAPSVESGYLNDPSIYSTLQSALAIPLESGESAIGVLSLYQDSRDAFSRDHLRVLQTLAPRLAGALADIAPRQLSFAVPSGTDSLPILRNIETELARARRLNLPLGVIVCSLEGSRAASMADTEVAMRTMMGVMRESSNDHELLARLSELEMVLVIPGGSKQTVSARAGRLTRTPFTSGDFFVATGAAAYPDDGVGSEQLLAAAERAVLASRAELLAAIAGGKRSERLDIWIQ